MFDFISALFAGWDPFRSKFQKKFGSFWGDILWGGTVLFIIITIVLVVIKLSS